MKYSHFAMILGVLLVGLVSCQNPATSQSAAARNVNPDGTWSLYRASIPGDHLYTTNFDEYRNLSGWSKEGVACNVWSDAGNGRVLLWRMNSGGGNQRHLYTANYNEVQNLIANGWHVENMPVNAYVYTSNVAGTIPLYRVSGASTDHVYTISFAEKTTAISNGYSDEGIACYVNP